MAPIEIPSPGTAIPHEAIDESHPKFVQRAGWYRFLRESAEVSGAYAPVVDSYDGPIEHSRDLVSYLVPHRREYTSDYQWRVRRARPPRYLQLGIAITSGVLTYRQPRRSLYPERLAQWLETVRADGTSWSHYVSTAVVPAMETYGWCLVYPYRPQLAATTAAQAEAERRARGLPEVMVQVITPEQIRAWERDTAGRYVWLRYVEQVYVGHGPLGGAGVTIHRHWWLTDRGWWYVDDWRQPLSGQQSISTRADPNRADASPRVQGDEVRYSGGRWSPSRRLEVGGSGTWAQNGRSLGAAPVAMWTLPGHATPAVPSALAQLEYYRLESELQTLEASTAFPQLFVPEVGVGRDPTEMIRGPHVVGSFPHDSRHVPMMLTPDVGPFEHFRQRLSDLASEALAPWALEIRQGASTGLALSMIQSRASNLYRLHAQACSQGEYATLRLVGELLGSQLPADARADWPTEFSELSGTAIVQDVDRFLQMDPGDIYRQFAIQEAARVILPHLTQDEVRSAQQALEAQIQAEADTVTEARDIDLMSQPAPEPTALDPDRERGAGGQERLAGRQG